MKIYISGKVGMPLATYAFQEWANKLLAEAEFLRSHCNVCIQHQEKSQQCKGGVPGCKCDQAPQVSWPMATPYKYLLAQKTNTCLAKDNPDFPGSKFHLASQVSPLLTKIYQRKRQIHAVTKDKYRYSSL